MASQTFTNTTIANEYRSTDTWYAGIELEDGTVTLADTVTELLASIMVDYEPEESLDGVEAAFEARTDFAVLQANMRQGLLALIATDQGAFNPDEESEETLTAIFSDRDVFVPRVELWDGKVPLVLVSTEYAPYSEVPRPTGNVEWIDPFTDLTLLTTLEKLGNFTVRFFE
jgi:hypothetical protein